MTWTLDENLDTNMSKDTIKIIVPDKTEQKHATVTQPIGSH